MRSLFVLIAAAALTGTLAGANEDLRCLPANPDGPNPSRIVYSDLQRQAYEALDRRGSAYDGLKSASQVADYQKRMREFMVQQLGGFPERTALNAASVGRVEGTGYRVEKVIFESQPNHHVTGCLFLPTTSPPYPAVLVSSGHSRTAKAAPYNQRIGIALARNGIAAFCYDPIGQGERSQILNAEGKPEFNGTTTEHFLVGVGSILVGRNTARYRIWDGIRAIDYLSSRQDIDANRIGFTGCSGGGTLTSYVMALDDRVACAAPACYLTTFRRLIETLGPQDAEQNIFGQIAFGLDHPDFILMRAPRPTLISATTSDYFDIHGSWDNLRQAKRIYARLGYSDQVDLVEAEGTHGVQPENLVAIVRWMRRWLLAKNGSIELGDIPTHSELELQCTPQGQVLLLSGERSVFELNVDEAQRLGSTRQNLWSKSDKGDALRAVAKAAGVRPAAEIDDVVAEDIGRVHRSEYHIDKLILRTKTGLPLPALTFHPPRPREDAYLYLHSGGKLVDDGPGGPIEKLVRDGYVVVAVDLRAYGETSDPKPDAILGDWKTFYLSYLMGQSLVGKRTEDTIACGRWIANYKTKTPRQVHLVAVAGATVPAIHAAALAPQQFTSVTLRQMSKPWSETVGERVPKDALTNTVHGALQLYDLSDLLEVVDKKKLTIIQ